MSAHPKRHPALYRVLVFCALLLVYAVYWPGIGGALYYDDYSNLKNLAGIKDWDTAFAFILDGGAGPLGRPLSLATFAVQADGWPANSGNLLHVNVLIHVANTFLLYLIGRRVLDLRCASEGALNFRIALGAALLWAVLPLLVSTTLITIQRMTGLAALFGLLGLLGFVSGYPLIQRRPTLGLLVQLGALGVGTLLALYSKENGALIPVFALVIDTVLLRSTAYPKASRRVLRCLLLACLLVILTYISPLWHNWFAFHDYRGFTPWQRLVTQSVIVWDYLRDAFLPQRPVMFGPFRDAHGIYTTWWQPTLASMGWAALLGVALFLDQARRYTWLLFGLLWFWAGHLLESTTPMLELVFEHRNYLAVYGFCLMLSWSAWHAQGNLARVAPALFGCYVAVLLAITAAMTTLWGRPLDAAQRWAEVHPRSARAALHAAFVELGPPAEVEDATQALVTHQRMERALHVLDRTAKVCPECLDVKLQAMIYACRVNRDDEIDRRFDNISAAASSADVSIAAVDAFFPLHQLIDIDACGNKVHGDLLRLTETVLSNPRAQSPTYKSRLHFVGAMIAQSMGDMQKLEQHLGEGEQSGIEAMPILQFQVHHYVEQGRHVEARDAIARRRAVPSVVDRPANVALLDELDTFVQEHKAKSGQ